MMIATRLPPHVLRPLAIVAWIGGAVVLATGLLVLGIPGLALGLGAAAGLVLLRRPAWAVGALVVVTIVAEGSEESVLGAQTARLYAVTAFFTPLELLLLLSTVSVLLAAGAQRRPIRLPGPFTPVLLLVALAMASGVVVGYFNGAGAGDLRSGVRVLLPLLLLPFLVVNVVRSRRDLQVVLGLVAGLAVFKAVEGLLAVAAGQGLAVDGQVITYYEPTANWLMLLFLLGVAAAALAGRRATRLSTWLLVSWPVVLLALLLSFRRSFWIAAVLALGLVAILGTNRLGRLSLVPVALLLAGGLWAVVNLSSAQLQGPLGERIESLSPTKVTANADDRYRLDERANVLAELRRQPVAGLGFEVPWRATRPLPLEHPGGRLYVHFAALYWWMRMGIMGLIAWLALTLSAMWAARDVWRRSEDPRLRAVGLAMLCGLIGLVVVESTTTFMGADVRFTLIYGAGLGLLSAMRSLSRTP